MFRAIRFMRAAIPVSVAIPARGRWNPARVSGPAAGGGNRMSTKSAAFTSPPMAEYSATSTCCSKRFWEPGVHKGFVLWFTGLSGAGKSTISNIIEARLRAAGAEVELLDGDVVRTHLSKGLTFSKEDRDINIRRIGFVAELLARHGVIVLVAAISPYRAMREEVRSTIPNFVEVYVECPIAVLAERDVKGLYKRALAGEIPNFTGVSDPYEPPLHPEVVVETDRETVEESVNKILARLQELGFISSPDGFGPIAPHGGQLVSCLVTGDRRDAL